MSDKALTEQLLGALRNHYIGPGEAMAGGTFIPEVGINGEFGSSRRCDALYTGFTSQSGRILIGHEIKVSRADWNHERAQLHKADTWADQCHAWYLVAPSEAIIPAAEVPPGWGLMVPNPRARRKFKIVVKAEVHKDRVPAWWAVRSMMARLDTLRAGEIQRVAAERVAADVEDAVEKAVKQSDAGLRHAAERAEKDAARIAALAASLGLKEIAAYDWHEDRDGMRPSAATLSAAIRFIRAGREVQRRKIDRAHLTPEGFRRELQRAEAAIEDYVEAAKAVSNVLLEAGEVMTDE
ncbi:MAG: hypothetical protein J7474_04550 [Arthrobacter sp.]|nr:hypothetical protein [Arthrobacter sp.]